MKMAFMIPIVKKDYSLYQASGSPQTSSPCGSLHSRSGNSSLSCSPGYNMEDKFKNRKAPSVGRTDTATSTYSVCSTKSASKSNDSFFKKLIGKDKAAR